MSDYTNQSNFQCSANNIFTNDMFRLTAFILTFVVYFFIGFILICVRGELMRMRIYRDTLPSSNLDPEPVQETKLRKQLSKSKLTPRPSSSFNPNLYPRLQSSSLGPDLKRRLKLIRNTAPSSSLDPDLNPRLQLFHYTPPSSSLKPDLKHRLQLIRDTPPTSSLKPNLERRLQSICNIYQDFKPIQEKKLPKRQYKSKSAPQIRKCFQPLQDPATLSVKQLQELTEHDEGIESESPSEYGSGGYMPISLGQTIGPNNQYQIIRKLGFGHFSTVWLCKETLHGQGYFAVKIVKASPVFRNVALDEIELLKCAKQQDPNNVGYNRVILMHEHFTESSISGYHISLMFDIMGPSLLELLIQSEFQGIEQHGVKRIIKQVLEGLMYLHEVCRIIHTDIKPENILITVKESYVSNMVAYVNRFREVGVQMPKSYVSAIKWEEHIELYGQASSSKAPATTETSRPRDVSWPESVYMKNSSKYPDRGRNTNMPSLLFIDDTIQVKIADLGNACWEDRHFANVIQTLQYRALEVIIESDYSFPADMWSVACVAFEISTGEYLFNPQSSQHLSAAEDHLGLIWEVLDGIPKYVALSGRRSKEFFEPATGLLRHISQGSMKIWTVEDVLVDKYGWKRVDAILFADFIQSLIEPDPDLRATASLALTKKWLKELDN